MVVYVVVGGWDYEGEQADSARVFVSRADADLYASAMCEDRGDANLTRYDYAEVRAVVLQEGPLTFSGE